MQPSEMRLTQRSAAMIERRLEQTLLPVAQRVQRFYTAVAASLCGLAFAALAFVLAFTVRFHGIQGMGWAVALAVCALLAVSACTFYARRRVGGLKDVARLLERAFPELDARLITAVEQRPAVDTGRYSYLQEQLIRQTLAHQRRYSWLAVLPGDRLIMAYAGMVLSWLLFAGALLCMATLSVMPPTAGPAAWWSSFSQQRPTVVAVEPGNAQVERGSAVLVTARFAGRMPEQVTLKVEPVQGGSGPASIPMTRSLEDPLFGAVISDVEEPIRYRIEYPGGSTEEYTLEVFEFPRVVAFDVTLTYPAYCRWEPKGLRDVRRLSVPAGTQIDLICRVNKPLASAILQDRQGEKLRLEPDPSAPLVYRAQWTASSAQRWAAEIVDAEGRQSKPPPAELIVQVVPNRLPTVRWLTPARDVRVSPLEELLLSAEVSDDYAVLRSGLALMWGGGAPEEIVLAQDTAGGKQQVHYLLDMEARQAQPDQLVAYYFWAEDMAEDGTRRRVESDMYFAEVRPFEEIFRQGQDTPSQDEQSQQQGGQSPNGSAAEQLADLQKEIINGTWKLKRSGSERTQPDQFAADARLLAESQAAALEQLRSLGERLSDMRSLEHYATAQQQMELAHNKLQEASVERRGERLLEALPAERSAYEALLRLRAREYEVVRSRQQRQSSGSSNSGNSRMQEQLNELQLRQDANRYETERQAAPPESEAQRQLRQTVNRLRELARRQQDLNEQIRQVESALQLARTEEERRQLQQQLKRLREEQQEILRDTEELQQRLQERADSDPLQQEQLQLERTRENVRRASEALEQGRLSQALAEGTRAERQFRELQDELRQRAASQYGEQMRQLRQQARQLNDRQQQIAEQMNQTEETQARSLRDATARNTLPEQLRQQAQDLERLMDAIQDVVQQAEDNEPLLARRLYETYRQTQQQEPQQRLQQAAQWLDRGFPEQARQPEQGAREAIGRLTQGVEQAAESVLGSELEALRRAQRELDEALAELLPNQAAADSQPDQSQPGERSATEGSPRNRQPPTTDNTDERAPQSSDRPAPQNTAQSSSARRPSSDTGDERQRPGGSDQTASSPRSAAPTDRAAMEQQRAESRNAAGPRDAADRPDAADDRNAGNGASELRNASEANASEARNIRQAEQPSGRSANSRPQLEDVRDGVRGGLQLSEDLVLPIFGDNFQEWADRLRSAEEMLDDPTWRAELARIRDRARSMRIDYRRQSYAPRWDLVETQIRKPLRELRDQIAEEIRRRDKTDRLAPVDRDPVPSQFDEWVRKYYERLGSGR